MRTYCTSIFKLAMRNSSVPKSTVVYPTYIPVAKASMLLYISVLLLSVHVFADSTDLLSNIKTDSPTKSWWKHILPSSAEKVARKAYKKGDYSKASQRFLEATWDNPASADLAYNQGNALYKQKKYDDAITAYNKARKNIDTKLAPSAEYNLGNSYFRRGERSIQKGEQRGIDDYREAMAHYKKALQLSPSHKNAKRNIEVVQTRIKELLDHKQDPNQQQQPKDGPPPPPPSAKAKEALARALQLCKQRRYAEGLQVLQQIMAEDQTAGSFSSYTQRIQDIIDILSGKTPKPPVPKTDPRAQQQGIGVI